jgi:glutamate synthase (NADPH/NADH) large chain
VFELLVRGGRDAPMAKAMLIPESLGNNATMPAPHHDLFLYCNAVMEPWDGPAALCGTDGRWVVAGLDRNGLRPLRYTITADNLLVVGSETGMVKIAEDQVTAKGRVGPGQCIGVDLDAGRLYLDCELKDLMAARKPYGQWVSRTTPIDEIVRVQSIQPAQMTGEALRRAQLAMGYTLEELEQILHPMVEDGAEAVGSMGDDTPIAVLSHQYRGLHHYFRQNFAQVTNPPIDSLRETRVMTLRTRLGNLGNILDEDPSQCDMLKLDSPVLSTANSPPCAPTWLAPPARWTAPSRSPMARRGCAAPWSASGARAEEGVRSGCQHVILTDEAQGRERAAIPMILAVRRRAHPSRADQLRTFTSLNVRWRRMPGRALLRPCSSARAPPPSMPIWPKPQSPTATAATCLRAEPRRLHRALQEGRGQGAAEGDVQDGHLRHLLLSRRHELRGDRPVPCAGGGVFPRASPRASRASGWEGWRGACWPCMSAPSSRR